MSASGIKADEGRALFGARHKVGVREMDTYKFAAKFPVIRLEFPVGRKNFPDSLLRESPCSAAVSCFEIVVLAPEIVIFPVKFPVCREFRRRRVRCALRRQPGSPYATYFDGFLSEDGRAENIAINSPRFKKTFIMLREVVTAKFVDPPSTRSDGSRDLKPYSA
jgi:hypothetical protein